MRQMSINGLLRSLILSSENRSKELQERIEALETAAESHRQRLVGLETAPKQEVKTPDTGTSRRLFGAPDSSGSHCPNEGISMQEIQYNVERLTLWVRRLTGRGQPRFQS